MEDIEDKQNYLREEIMDKGYSPEQFQEFMMQQVGTEEIDLEQYSMQSLQEIVEKFKQLYASGDNNTDNVISTNEEPQQEETDEVNNINNEENIIQPKKEENIISTNSNQLGESPFDSYEYTVTCKKLSPNQFSEIYNLYFTITEPEHKKNGIFSSGYFQYTIMNKKDNSSIVRKLKDFEWMKAKLFDLFPGIFLPPIGPSHLNLKDDSPKKISYLSKFINALSQNRLVRSTEIYKAFFSLPQEEFENKKKRN